MLSGALKSPYLLLLHHAVAVASHTTMILTSSIPPSTSHPRSLESLFQMECVLTGKNEIFNDAGEHTTTVVTGRVVRVHAIEPLLQRSEHSGMYKFNSLEGYESMARMGGDTWCKLGESIDIKRPKV